MIDEIVSKWNEQADEFNYWENLGLDEQIEFAVKETAKKCVVIAEQRRAAVDPVSSIACKIQREFGV